MTIHDHTTDERTTDETEPAPGWRDTARSVMMVAAGLCVLALALLTLDVPGLIVVALVGIPAAISVYRCIQTVFAHEAALDALLAAWHARWRARVTAERPTAYTGETVKLDEVAR